MKGNETFYGLSCNHVMKHWERSEIIHPALNDHLNYLNFHLQEYGKWVKEILDPDIFYAHTMDEVFEYPIYRDQDEMFAKFIELEQIKERYLNSPKATARKREHITFYENAFRKGLPQPRVIGRYTNGVSRNVMWTDNRQYFIDAAIAELEPQEKGRLEDSQTAEMIGAGYPLGDIVRFGRAATRPLCKSGRTTGFTDSGRHANPAVFVNAGCYEEADTIKKLVNVLKTNDKICGQCAERSGWRNLFRNENIIRGLCGFCIFNQEGLEDRLWWKNCLCIDKSGSVNSRPGFSTAGDSGAVVFERSEDDSLRGFGIIFGKFEHSFGIYSLASPLHIALETLSRLQDVNLALVSNYNE